MPGLVVAWVPGGGGEKRIMAVSSIDRFKIPAFSGNWTTQLQRPWRIVHRGPFFETPFIQPSLTLTSGSIL